MGDSPFVSWLGKPKGAFCPAITAGRLLNATRAGTHGCRVLLCWLLGVSECVACGKATVKIWNRFF